MFCVVLQQQQRQQRRGKEEEAWDEKACCPSMQKKACDPWQQWHQRGKQQRHQRRGKEEEAWSEKAQAGDPQQRQQRRGKQQRQQQGLGKFALGKVMDQLVLKSLKTPTETFAFSHGTILTQRKRKGRNQRRGQKERNQDIQSLSVWGTHLWV